MKKTNILFSAAFAVFVMVSCSKDIIDNKDTVQQPNLVPMTFSVAESVEETATDSKTTLVIVDNKKTINWVANDKVGVFGVVGQPTSETKVNTDNQIFTAGSSGASTTLSGYVEDGDNRFYALYPYQNGVSLTFETSTSGSVTALLNNVTIPVQQKAVAGSFDPDAYLFASLTYTNSFTFYTPCSLVGFQLNDPDVSKIKSIRLYGNNAGDVLASEKGQIKVYGSSSTHVVTDGKSNYVELVLDGSDKFQNSVQYYFVVRRLKLESGITIYVEYEDGTVKQKSSNNEFDVSVNNCVKSLGALDGASFSKVAYSKAFELGYDVIVGDKVYNKSNISGTIIDDSVTDLTASLSGQEGGLFFLQGESYNITSQVVVSKNVVVCGNDPSKRTMITMGTSSYFTHNSSIFALKNLEINAEQCANYVINKNTTSDSESLLVDDCKISMLKPMLYIASGKGICKSVKLKDSDFVMKAATATQVVQMQNGQSDTQFEFNMSNSIVYSSSASATRIVLLPRTTNQSNVELTNNTFYNYRSGAKYGLIHGTSKYSFVASNNLVVLPTYNNGEYFICSTSDSDFTKISENYFCRTDTDTELNGKFYESGYTSDAGLFGTLATVEKKSVNDYPYRPSDIDAKYGAKR